MDKIIKKIEKKADAGEVFWTSATGHKAFIDTNEKSMITNPTENGYGIRVLKDKKVGFAFSNDPSTSGIEKTIGNALKSAKANRENPNFEFPSPTKKKGRDSFDKRIANITIDKISDGVKLFLDMVKKEKELSIPISKFKFSTLKYHIINSNGIDFVGKGTLFFIEAYTVAKKGKIRSETIVPKMFRYFRERDILDAAKECIRVSKDSLNAKPVKTGIYEVIFHPQEIAALFGGTFAESVCASARYNGWSPLIGKENKVVVDKRLTITDDIDLKNASACFAVDQEGIYRKKRRIFNRGVFKGFVFDSFYAALMNEKPTGNGRRRSKDIEGWYTANPINGLNNVVFNPGNSSLDKMIKETKKGVYLVRSAWPLADAVSGLFSIELRNGFYIEKGEIKHPIKFTIVNGNLYDMFKNKLISFSKKREITPSSRSAFDMGGLIPYMKFKDISIASAVEKGK